jgi:hypothetical protein
MLLKKREKERKKEVAERRRHKQLLDDLNETRACRKLKEEALDRTQRRTRFGLYSCRKTDYRMNMYE